VPQFGVAGSNAALMAAAEWNARGGVLGHGVQIIIKDSQCDPVVAAAAVNEAIAQDGVHYLVGEYCSRASIPVSEVAEEHGVVMISPVSTAPDVTQWPDGTTKDYVFRACFIDPFQGKVGAQFARVNLAATTAFILYDPSNDYSHGLASAFETEFLARGGTIAGQQTYAPDTTDFSMILSAVAASRPDVIYLPDYYNIANLVTGQARQMGITAPFIGGDGWDAPDLDLAATDGSYFINHYSPLDMRPVVQDWVQRYQTRYGTQPDTIATLTYDALNVLLTSIVATGSDAPAVVKGTLAGGTFDAITGPIQFDAWHNPIKSATVLQIKDGAIHYAATVHP
jgi:branched-chain amino acid transport system substrate-binding protein